MDQGLWAVVGFGFLLLLGAAARRYWPSCPDSQLTPEELAKAMWAEYGRNLARQNPERGPGVKAWHELGQEERNSLIAASIVAISEVRARTR